MGNPELIATRIIGEVRDGASLSLVLEGSDGKAWDVKDSGPGPASELVEYLSIRLGIAAGLRILAPSLIRITPSLFRNAVEIDPEVRERLLAGEGMHPAYPHHPEKIGYLADNLEAVPEGERLAIFLFDILLLNGERTRARPSLFFLDGALHGSHYDSARAVQAAVAGLEADEDEFLPELKRHPFYRENHSGMLFAEMIPRLERGALERIRTTVPYEWDDAFGPESKGGERTWELLGELFRNAPKILAARFAKLKAIVAGPEYLAGTASR
ncbi:MAG: HipA family kinase [Fibrobacteria bacterium]